MQSDLLRRVQHEAEHQPDISTGHHALLSHAVDGYWYPEVEKIFGSPLGSDILEIGCSAWLYIEQTGVKPNRIVCINIYQPHLDQGIALSKTSINKPEFLLMDAHNMNFPDGSFDTVFGLGVLHHLQTAQAVKEFHRVLRPKGKILFKEPLGMNPVANAVRRMTPGSHTADEEPLSRRHFKIIGERFRLKLHYQQLFTVPAALLSKALFSSDKNALTRGAYLIDKALLKLVPGIGRIYRHVIIEGERKD